jgi:hypothetical protein
MISPASRDTRATTISLAMRDDLVCQNIAKGQAAVLKKTGA